MQSIIRLFRTFVDENPEIWTSEFERDLYRACETIVTHEDAFIELAFEKGSIEGLEAQEVKAYIRYIADRRLTQLGLQPIYKEERNPLPWLDAMEVREKDDSSPVTEADEAAEAFILEALGKMTPDIPVVAEEAVAAGNIPEVTGKRFWLVDPLDGTKEFINRNGEFTVNIALIENGLPIAGVVHGFVDVFIAGLRIFREQCRRGHHLAGLAIAALNDIELLPRRLDGCARLAVQTFNCRNLLTRNIRHGRHAGADRLTVDVHSAGPALRQAAAELCPGQSREIPNRPEQRHIFRHIQLYGLTVQFETHHLSQPFSGVRLEIPVVNLELGLKGNKGLAILV